MKFMELDEAGFILHVCDDPGITRLPVVNRFITNKVNELSQPVSVFGHRVLGHAPEEHIPHLLPRMISDEHFSLVMSSGTHGWDDRRNWTGEWHFIWDENQAKPVKKYITSADKKDYLPARAKVRTFERKPCNDCPDGEKTSG
jgi:hypothetical protein